MYPLYCQKSSPPKKNLNIPQNGFLLLGLTYMLLAFCRANGGHRRSWPTALHVRPDILKANITLCKKIVSPEMGVGRNPCSVINHIFLRSVISGRRVSRGHRDGSTNRAGPRWKRFLLEWRKFKELNIFKVYRYNARGFRPGYVTNRFDKFGGPSSDVGWSVHLDLRSCAT